MFPANGSSFVAVAFAARAHHKNIHQNTSNDISDECQEHWYVAFCQCHEIHRTAIAKSGEMKIGAIQSDFDFDSDFRLEEMYFPMLSGQQCEIVQHHRRIGLLFVRNRLEEMELHFWHFSYQFIKRNTSPRDVQQELFCQYYFSALVCDACE